MAGRRGAKAKQEVAFRLILLPEYGLVRPFVAPENATHSCAETLADRAETIRDTRPAPNAEASSPTQDAPRTGGAASPRSSGWPWRGAAAKRSTCRADRATPARVSPDRRQSRIQMCVRASQSVSRTFHSTPRPATGEVCLEQTHPKAGPKAR